jgi:hypothetical protein
MTRLEERLQRELAGVSEHDVDQGFVDLFAARLRNRRRRRTLLLALATIAAAALAAGLILQIATVLPI